MRAAAIALLLLAGCDRAAAPTASLRDGARLEAAARTAGLVVDPASVAIHGAYGRDGDRLCIVPGEGGDRVGVIALYGDNQRCVARGSVERRGNTLRLALGDCQIDARFDGDRIVLPAQLDVACHRACTGRATLEALTVDRLSQSVSEAAAMPDPNGHPLCGG